MLVWVYYSAQILFLGAEFTQVYAHLYGSKIAPDEDAQAVEQGPDEEEAPRRGGGRPAAATT